MLLCLAAAALVTPVLLSTASALETQAFVVVYFAAAAFLVGALADHSRQRAS